MSYTLVSGYINIETLETNNKRDQTFMIYKENGQKLINLPIIPILFKQNLMKLLAKYTINILFKNALK